MDFRKKVIGFLAASALTFSMAAGVAANDSRTGTVQLDGGSCQVVITSGNLDFGTWTWNGTQYVTEGDQSSALVVAVTPAWSQNTGARPTCDIAVSTNGLIHIENSRAGSGLEDLTAQVGTGASQPIADPANPAVFELGGGSSTIGVKLNSVGSEFRPGEYRGQFNVTINDGQ